MNFNSLINKICLFSILLSLVIITTQQNTQLSSSPQFSPSQSRVDDINSLSTSVDDCCCSVDTVLDSNGIELNPILNKIVNTRFFKYFKLDLFSTCPFWISNSFCGGGGCEICECDEDEVPIFWKQQEKKTDRVDVSTPDNFLEWKDSEENMWIAPGREEDMSYVNLQDYPEGNTGYDGGKIWQSIYNENCFKGDIDSMCLEERVFYRLLSGLHTSITVHIARQYEWDEVKEEWISNSSFWEKISQHPDRMKNLYFAFLFLLRAAHKVAPVLEDYHYATGNPVQDAHVKEMMHELLQVKLLCSPNFDESTLFNSPGKDEIKQQFKNHFRNISMVLNCITCEKCKVYSKLQTTAIGTALKILFGGQDTALIAKQLQRNEIIALVNTLRQFSNSIEFIKYFKGESFAPSSVTKKRTIHVERNSSVLTPTATLNDKTEGTSHERFSFFYAFSFLPLCVVLVALAFCKYKPHQEQKNKIKSS